MRTTILALAGLLALTAASASAQTIVQGIPGASCATDQRTTGTWEYRAGRIVNTDTDPWGIMVATCPVSSIAPGVQAQEYRISLNDPERRATWCDVYAYNGTRVRRHNVPNGFSGQVVGAITSPLGGPGLAEMTIHCLVQNGASIDRIELIWYKP